MPKDEAPKPKYDYFSKPDGEDVANKMWHVLKPTAITALAFSTFDVLCYSRPKGYAKTLGRYAYLSLPLFGMSTAFVLTSNFAASVRKTQDKGNWAIGGAAAGGIFGVWWGTQPVAFTAAAALSLIAVLKKYSVEEGYNLIPKDVVATFGYDSGDYDFTLTKQIPGNWTTGKE